ncbi:MAG: hypothetical protein IKO74_04875 [Selenomonadaceae bacterium]|nr:hypothetical protein [Selenomonadaceae bacterium]
MAYPRKIDMVAKEFHCSEKDLVWFFLKRGYNSINYSSTLSEDDYNLARKHFLGSSSPKPPAKPKPSTPADKPAQKISVTVDYRTLLKKYDAEELKLSPTKYFEAARSVVDELLDILQRHESAQKDTIAELLQISLKLNEKYIDNPNLTPEENSLFAERQKFFAEKFSFGTDKAKARLLSVKAQAEISLARFEKRLNAIYDGENLFCELAALEAEPRPSFAFLVENLSQAAQDAMLKPEFLAQNIKFVTSVASYQKTWSDAYKMFKTSLREEFFATCREDGLDEEIFSLCYDDWQTKRFAIEERFLPLIDFALKGKLLHSIERVLKIFGEYREAVDKFYLHERKKIYRKFAFTAGGHLQEKFETESELYKLAEKLQRDLQEIIFASDTEEKIFLLRWSEPLLNLPLDEIKNFIRDKELDAISEEVLRKFAALRQKNFAEYLADGKAYGEAFKRREEDFNTLIFRMRKDLTK